MKTQALLENHFYHIYNRGNNGANLFYNHNNYIYFLKKYEHYLSDYIETFAYCLLPNHFHLLAKVKTYDSFPASVIPQRDGRGAKPELQVSEQFRRLFLSYAQAINKQEQRTGSLFENVFKRKEVNNQNYFSKLIFYIHSNPQKHGITDNFKEYLYSSYNSIPSDKPTKLNRADALNWFGGKEGYYQLHSEMKIMTTLPDEVLIEDI